MEATRSSEEEHAGGDCSKECSMCGDVGFSTELFQCKECSHRWQHTYCSRLYPNVDSGNWVCDWCFQAAAKPRRASRTVKRKAMASRNNSSSSSSIPSSYSGSEIVEWSQFDALEFLLEVAQSASDGNCDIRETCVERQACSSKRTSARKCTGFSPKRPRCGINDRSLEKWQQFSKAKLPVPAASKGIGGRRYKLLSDVL